MIRSTVLEASDIVSKIQTDYETFQKKGKIMTEKFKGIHRTVIVCFDHANGNIPVLIVGEKKNNELSVVAAYKGQEALDLYSSLTAKEES